LTGLNVLILLLNISQEGCFCHVHNFPTPTLIKTLSFQKLKMRSDGHDFKMMLFFFMLSVKKKKKKWNA